MSVVTGGREPVDVALLERTQWGAARRVLREAFLDDPAWVAVGPLWRPWRRAVEHLFFGADMRVLSRYHGTQRVGMRGEDVLGTVCTYDSERYPPPELMSMLYLAPAFALSGPGPSIRGLRLLDVFERHHPKEPHVYVEYLAVGPWAQRSGVGRAMMKVVFDDAHARELPVYLETATPENVPYYSSMGFRVMGEDELPRGAHAWFMWRDCAPG